MWNPLQEIDRRQLALGAGIALASGLALGAVMQPRLDLDRLGGPQTLLPGGGQRAAYTSTDIGVARYQGQLPEYVVGTDWTRPAQLEPVVESDAPTEEQGDVMAYAADKIEPSVRVVHAAWDEPAPAPVYPSQTGGVVHEADRPAPPPPPEEMDLAALDG